MIRRLIILGLLTLCGYQSAFAQGARELSQEEIRKVVESNISLSPRTILDAVRKRVAGEIVDVRMFDADGICYRVLLVLPNGKLASVIVDAATGVLLAGNSRRAKSVVTVARSHPSKSGRSKSNKNGGRSANANNKGGSGNGNSGGNSNGGGNNSGGNGNGGGKGKK